MDPAMQILTSLITPAVLISACSGLIFSTANRLGRIFDRVNALKQDAEGALTREAALPDKRLEYLQSQLRLSRKRAGLIQRAMLCLYSATALFVATGLAIAFSALVTHISWVIAVLSLAGAGFLLTAALLLLYESRYNLSFIYGQIDFVGLLTDDMSRREK
ncbi:MAG: DUF2721 domain-containing protein [Spirochaetia bacterium]|nr:DUF2721 domain-containing protein [Spirochaetia bacterium]